VADAAATLPPLCAPGRPAGPRSRTEIASPGPNRSRRAFATVVATDRARDGPGLSTRTVHLEFP
jgi:hypothetical protein